MNDIEQSGDSLPESELEVLKRRVFELEAALEARNRADLEGPTSTLPPVELQALRLQPHGWAEGWGLRPAPSRRAWMDEKTLAYHCLPLVIANQWGWQVLCPTDVRVSWIGGAEHAALTIEMDPAFAPAIRSQFGMGIITFSPPWLFRTPRGWDLLVKAPANRWKSNCQALEGIVETWWLNYTFTINWKLTEPGVVSFAKGESLAQLVPVPHATFDQSRAIERPIAAADPEAARELLAWREERRRRMDEPQPSHLLYRKAAGIEEHLVRVPVPPIAAGEISDPTPEP
jgi:hypothetical protein